MSIPAPARDPMRAPLTPQEFAVISRAGIDPVEDAIRGEQVLYERVVGGDGRACRRALHVHPLLDARIWDGPRVLTVHRCQIGIRNIAPGDGLHVILGRCRDYRFWFLQSHATRTNVFFFISQPLPALPYGYLSPNGALRNTLGGCNSGGTLWL